jgi:hypothetical protein
MPASSVALLLIAVAGTDPSELPVVVTGGSRCPQAAEVTARLGALLPPSRPGNAPRDVVALDDQSPELRIVLRGADGSVANERRLPRRYSCDELAAATAAVIAAWLSDIHPEFALAAARPPDRTPPSPVPPAAARAEAPTIAVASAPAAASPALHFDGAAGLAGTLGPSQGSPGWAAGVAVAAGVRATRLGARLALMAGTPRVFPLGRGELQVSRTSLLLGPTFRLTSADASLTADLGVFVAASRLVLRGNGFPRAGTSAGLDGGGGASLRVGLRREWAPFLELAATVWPVARAGLEQVNGNTRTLPKVEIGLTCGILFSGAGGRVRSAALGPHTE